MFRICSEKGSLFGVGVKNEIGTHRFIFSKGSKLLMSIPLDYMYFSRASFNVMCRHI